MALNLNRVTLESLSDIRHSFWLGKHPGRSYQREVLVIRFEGRYRYGSGGNPDATFMRAVAKAGIEAFEPDAVISDLSELSYDWGDEIETVFGIGGDLPGALVVGPKCRNAIGTLCFGEASSNDACENEWIFDSLDAAWTYVTGLIDEGEIPRIHEAAANGDRERIKQLLEAGESPNRLNSSSQTPLHITSSPVVVRLLIEAGADPKARDRLSRTPLHMVENVECARLLLDAGADPDARTSGNLSPLGFVRTVEIARLLIEAGADVHLRERRSLLHSVRTPELARLYIEAGLDVNWIDEHGHTPLDVAEENRQIFQRQAERLGFAVDAEHARRYGEIVACLLAKGAKHGNQGRA